MNDYEKFFKNTYSSEKTKKDSMGGALIGAIGKSRFILGNVELCEAIDCALNKIMIMQFTSINWSTQL